MEGRKGTHRKNNRHKWKGKEMNMKKKVGYQNSSYLFINFKTCKLCGSIWKYSDHLCPISLVESYQGLLLNNSSEASEDPMVFVVHRLCLKKDLDPVKGGHCCFSTHASHTCDELNNNVTNFNNAWKYVTAV